uniref:Uncharacterized protein n=1 Tax=Paramoeba aestuarina TaxID=180227 RepID=A0A7S4PGS5_9EUKA|mmetsp:Transcript_6127/g.9281  ORF Transcript_6127/g.9281 Transcript_6127/m.9281 type:complete len:329 (+) Transcript_6127:3-989(+)
MFCLKDSGKCELSDALRDGGVFNPLIWWHVPGYTLLTRELLRIMERSSTSDDREAEFSKASSKFLLTDPELLSEYLSIVIPRTSAHSEKAVMHLFECLGEWWKTLKENSIPLPESLNIDLLIECFNILVEIDHHVSLNLLFVFLYSHLQSFSTIPSFKTKLIGEKILGSWFFHFFLHWDFKIRCTFYQILAFQVHKQEKVIHPMFNYEEELSNIQSWVEAKLKANINTMSSIHTNPPCDPSLNTFFNSNLEIYIPKALAEYQCYEEYKLFWMQRAPDHNPSLLSLSDIVATLKKNNVESEAFEKIRIPRPQVLMSLEETSMLKAKEIM